MRDRTMMHMLCAGNASWACRSFSTGVGVYESPLTGAGRKGKERKGALGQIDEGLRENRRGH